MPRILFITSKSFSPWVGSSHRLRHDLGALVALGYTVDLLTAPSAGLPPSEGINLLSVPRMPLCRRMPDGPCFRRLLLDALLLFKAVFLASRTSYELIHGIDDGGVVAWVASRLTKNRCVFERQSDSVQNGARGLRRFWQACHSLAERMALKRADAVIGNDATIVSLLARLNRRSRACVIPDIPAVTEEVTQPSRNLARARYLTGPETRIVTCVGSYTRFQGLDLLFNAMPYVLDAIPQTRFVVVGGDEHAIRRMRHALEKAGIEQAVVFPGRIQPDELAALLSVSDLLVSPRRAGTAAPIKVLDYLHSGTPVVAADTPANRAILSADNAVITRPSPDALAGGILKILRDPALGTSLARHGRETLRHENRTPEAFRSALRCCYDYVLSAP